MKHGKIKAGMCSNLAPLAVSFHFLFPSFFKPLISLFSFLILSLAFQDGIRAQYSFSRWDSVPVIIDSIPLSNPWAGGLNFPQFSTVDLDGNGVKDLFVFDRSGLNGKKTLTFINNNIADSSSFIHKPAYQEKFPPIMGWALMADYNKDGKQDLFTANSKGGVSVYRNAFSTSEGLKFVLMDSLLQADFGTTLSNIYVSPWDVPAIEDIDNDGDLDILSFYIGGVSVYFYRNISMENFGQADSLVFEVGDQCWGKFNESTENCNISLGVICKGSIPLTDSLSSAKHAGSTLLAIDLDGDKDKELLVGDLVCNYLTQLSNGGDLQNANMISKNIIYPSDMPVKLTQFPASFWLDVDNDSVKDLVVAPSATNISENFLSSWMYKNTGSDSLPEFDFITKSFLQSSMIDKGEGANVAFFDVNADSLTDLIIGNSGYYKTGATYLSELAYYKNTGTKTNPTFDLVTRDFAGISSLGLTDVYPCFGDIDDDGDQDMIIGEDQGELFLFTNSAGAGNTANFTLTGPGYKGLDVGRSSTPQLADVNRDGKPDLLIGERNGNINYFENTGTASNAEFILVTDSFGKINIKEAGAITAYSAPRLVQLDSIPKYSLLVGSESGKIFLFKGVEDDLTGTFIIADTLFQGINEGIRSTLDAADLNDDGNPELLVGNYRGGVALYKNNAQPWEPPLPKDTFSLDLFPNPARDFFYVNIPEINISAELYLYNMLGQLVLYNQVTTAGKYYVNTRNFAYGIYYMLFILDGNTVFNEKVVFLK